jgi:hypothetical protein
MESSKKPRKRGWEILQLNRFAGRWHTEGTMLMPDQDPVEFYGTDTYKWLPGGFFMLHEVDVLINGVKVQNVEIIGFDPDSGKYPMHYYDNEGESGITHGWIDVDAWSIDGAGIRFRGSFSEDDRVLSGVWEQLTGEHWQRWMDIRLSKEA